MYEDLVSEASEASEPEVPELEVSEALEVYQGEGVPELLRGTRRGLVLIHPQTRSQSWNQPGERNTLENEKPLDMDLCRVEKVVVWMGLL